MPSALLRSQLPLKSPSSLVAGLKPAEFVTTEDTERQTEKALVLSVMNFAPGFKTFAFPLCASVLSVAKIYAASPQHSSNRREKCLPCRGPAPQRQRRLVGCARCKSN